VKTPGSRDGIVYAPGIREESAQCVHCWRGEPEFVADMGGYPDADMEPRLRAHLERRHGITDPILEHHPEGNQS
jgi:hypothetical protein